MIPQHLQHLARDIRISHSIFALPFALLATFLAAASVGARRPDAVAVGLIVLCMVLARTVAMTMNRWADAAHDATNPRTSGRAIPAGRLSRRYVLGASMVCAAGFVLGAAGFWWFHGNPWPLLASPVVLAWLVAYSFTKRFTWLCHLFLGSALALSPLAAALAIEPAWLGRPEPYLLALMVMCWVAGFDVIYALQDVSVDRKEGMFSMPARLGVEPALWCSRGLHLVGVVALVVMARINSDLGPVFAVGVALVAVLLVIEHALVWRSRTHHIHMAFFTINGIISVLLGTLGIVDVYV
ncbi:MAG: 4-hydroxybenzoate octaprenyltransferase [Phycisphaeraceae bacterium]|nr:4-hydroxybenzoate octaprenyltransferase [Phycisphaeraceae bacterium]